MQALAAEFSGCRRKPPSLFERRRVRNVGKVAAKRSEGGIPLLFGKKSLKTVCFVLCILKKALKWMRSVCLRDF